MTNNKWKEDFFQHVVRIGGREGLRFIIKRMDLGRRIKRSYPKLILNNLFVMSLNILGMIIIVSGVFSDSTTKICASSLFLTGIVFSIVRFVIWIKKNYRGIKVTVKVYLEARKVYSHFCEKYPLLKCIPQTLEVILMIIREILPEIIVLTVFFILYYIFLMGIIKFRIIENYTGLSTIKLYFFPFMYLFSFIG